jgi:hypothetical protein
MKDSEAIRVDATGWTFAGTLGDLAAEHGNTIPNIAPFTGYVLSSGTYHELTNPVVLGELEADTPVTIEGGVR